MGYGARKRLQAATYHLLERPLLILDEVDAGLSSRAVEALLDALAGQGAGILLITHDLVLARGTADRILAMEQGRIVADLQPRDFHRLVSIFEEVGQT
jgi:energy-coupling factor transport system ATP-binding protein